MAHRIGKYTIVLDQPPSILATAAIGSKKEREGPLEKSFDFICDDPYFEQDSWEKAESIMQTKAVNTALGKAGLRPQEIDAIFAGDLLNQCVGSSYGLRELGIPFMGVYGACSTMAESLLGASVFLDSGALNRAVACTSSHFCAAERQYRFPLEYGGQRTPTAQWTATAAGAAVLGKDGPSPYVRAVTIGTIEDLGITDANNMGAAMAGAAEDTLVSHFKDTGRKPSYYDAIFTGDLGHIGKDILIDLASSKGYNIRANYNDCGVLMFDKEKQDTHSGGSGCGCIATVFSGYVYQMLQEQKYKKVLMIATGALMNSTSSQQGESIPGIAHAISIEI